MMGRMTQDKGRKRRYEKLDDVGAIHVDRVREFLLRHPREAAVALGPKPAAIGRVVHANIIRRIPLTFTGITCTLSPDT